MYPVYINEEGTKLPTDGEYYVVAGNGIWFRKDTGVFTGFIPVPSVAFLEDLDIRGDTIKCVLPKIPHELVMKTKKFFVQVFKKYHAEACVVLYYDKETGKCTIKVPRQWNDHTAVRYIRPSFSHKEDGLAVGTIHSHCDFGAFHSGTDHIDESTFDGVHITFGDITNKVGMSISASIVLNGMRCRVDPLVHLEGILADDEKQVYKITQPEGDVDFEAWAAEVDAWMEQVNQGDPPTPWTEENIIAWKEKNGNTED